MLVVGGGSGRMLVVGKPVYIGFILSVHPSRIEYATTTQPIMTTAVMMFFEFAGITFNYLGLGG